MVSSNLLSFLSFFGFSQEIFCGINFKILILHFEKKNCSYLSLKQSVFEISQLPGNISWKENDLFLCQQDCN
jgi:hypothetical protein